MFSSHRAFRNLYENTQKNSYSQARWRLLRTWILTEGPQAGAPWAQGQPGQHSGTPSQKWISKNKELAESQWLKSIILATQEAKASNPLTSKISNTKNRLVEWLLWESACLPRVRPTQKWIQQKNPYNSITKASMTQLKNGLRVWLDFLRRKHKWS
jgi:hypothetical protein